jgi:hypothetical protein
VECVSGGVGGGELVVGQVDGSPVGLVVDAGVNVGRLRALGQRTAVKD